MSELEYEGAGKDIPVRTLNFLVKRFVSLVTLASFTDW